MSQRTLENVELYIDGIKVATTSVTLNYADGDWVNMEVSAGFDPAIVEKQKYTPKMTWWGYDVARGKSASVNYVIQDNKITEIVTPDNTNWVKRAFESEWKYEDKEMDKACDERSACISEDGRYGGERLAQKIKELELTPEQRTLRKYGIINEVGLLTAKGEKVLLNHLLTAYTEDIVQDLKDVEEAERVEREGEE